jgi:hypothetical protein
MIARHGIGLAVLQDFQSLAGGVGLGQAGGNTERWGSS